MKSSRRKIAIATSTRADWGLLSPIAKRLKERDDVDLKIIATNAHLSARYGMSVSEIENDGFIVDARVETINEKDGDNDVATSRSMARCLAGFAETFARLTPDLIIILGDRYEMLAVASAATIARIPICHLHGGETTEGAIDNAIRDAITKLSSLHLVSTEPYREKVISMGEPAENVINTGAIGVYNVAHTPLMNRGELQESLSFFFPKGTLLVTYHPATLDTMPISQQCDTLLKALDQFPDNRILITYPNSDPGAEIIISMIRAYEKADPDRVRVIPTLGRRRYLSALQFVAAVVGNSSSGIIEVPSTGVPTVNIGDRQTGRIAAKSVINCRCSVSDIANAISRALTMNPCTTDNPYYKENTLDLIVEAIATTPLSNFKKASK